MTASQEEMCKRIGYNAKLYRKRRGYTEEAVAKAIGISRSTLIACEAGECEMRVGVFLAFCRLYDVTPGQLMGNEE